MTPLSCLRLRLGEQHLQIPAQMMEAVGGNLGSALRLGEDEGALDYRLDVERETFRVPGRVRRVAALGCGDDLGYLLRVRAEMGVARTAERRVRVVGFLDHRAEEACEFR